MTAHTNAVTNAADAEMTAIAPPGYSTQAYSLPRDLLDWDEEVAYAEEAEAASDRLDEEGEHSFPASDPPSSTSPIRGYGAAMPGRDG